MNLEFQYALSWLYLYCSYSSYSNSDSDYQDESNNTNNEDCNSEKITNRKNMKINTSNSNSHDNEFSFSSSSCLKNYINEIMDEKDHEKYYTFCMSYLCDCKLSPIIVPLLASLTQTTDEDFSHNKMSFLL